MRSVFRFDLLNFRLSEPVDLNTCECSSYPMVKRLILFPREPGYPRSFVAWPSMKDREVTAFVEIEGTMDELGLQQIAQDFMIWVCWLLSLAELHHVYYWGSHHYSEDTAGWKLRSSAWKVTTVKNWEPSGSRIFEGSVLFWRLPEFLSRGLKSFSKPGFARDDFILALHLFLDGLPLDQLSEMRFVKKWIAFEKLVNEQAKDEGYAYVFGEPKSREFGALTKTLAEVIKKHPSVRTAIEAKDSLVRNLSSLERVPVKVLARRFLDSLSIQYDGGDIDRIVDARNGILHYIEAKATPEELWKYEQTLSRILCQILCKKLGWDYEKELHERYVAPHRDPLPEYAKLHEESLSLEIKGSGRLETEDQAINLECGGRVTWNREKIDCQLISYDPERFKIVNLHLSLKSVRIQLTTEDGSKVLVDRGKISHLETPFVPQTPGGSPQNAEVPFNVFALRVFVDFHGSP
jgi:hypothetical protein